MSAVESQQPVPAPGAEVPRRYGRSVLVAGLRGVVRGWRVVLPVVVVGALLQALLVLPNPLPGLSAYAGVLAAASFLVLLVSASLLTASGLEAVDGSVRWAAAWSRARRSAGWFALWFVVLVLVAAVGLMLWTWPGLVWLALTPYVLPAASDGRRGALLADLRALAARPGRWLVTTLLVAAVCGVAWLLGAVTGFFVGGAVGAAITWLWFGVLGAWFLASWSALWRSTPVGAAEDPARA